MKTSRISILIVVLFSIFFFSCQTKKGTIDDLRDLRTEVRVNGENFDDEDWEDFESRHIEVIERLEEYDLSAKEEQFVEKLENEIEAYKLRYNAKGVIGGAVSTITGIIDQVTGLNTSSYAEAITQSSKTVKKETEKNIKHTIWFYAAWVGGTLLFSILCYLCKIIISTTTVKRRSHPKNRRR